MSFIRTRVGSIKINTSVCKRKGPAEGCVFAVVSTKFLVATLALIANKKSFVTIATNSPN